MGDIVKIVDRAEFEKRSRESLRIINCPECGGKIEIAISFSSFADKKAIIRCEECGHTVKESISVAYFECDNSFGTFYNVECLAKGLSGVIKKWNKQAEFDYNKREQQRQEYLRQKFVEEQTKFKTVFSELNTNAEVIQNTTEEKERVCV